MEALHKLKGLNDALVKLKLEIEPVKIKYDGLMKEVSIIEALIQDTKVLLDEEVRGGDASAYFDKFERDGVKVSCRKLPSSVIVDDVDKLPDSFIRLKREADKATIKKHLEAGDDVAGARLSEEEYRLVVDCVD